MSRTCSRCGEQFSMLADRHHECVECRMAGGDYDDREERAKSRARSLVAALARKRATP